MPALILLARHPGLSSSGFLEHHLSLTALPLRVQRHIGDVLFFPLGAMLVVFVRLTLGLRVLGPFRPVLIAIAFRITGIPFALAFLCLTIGILVSIRPVVKSLAIPYFGRISVMLSAVSAIIVGALLASDWTHWESLQGAAYFPIVVLCLTAEGFDRTILREGLRSALGRGLATAATAAVLALLMRQTWLKHLLLRCPELLLVQIGGIIIISKFFAWRLFQATDADASEDGAGRSAHIRPVQAPPIQWPSAIGVGMAEDRLSEGFKPSRGVSHEGRGRLQQQSRGVINRFGKPCPESYARRHIGLVVDALAGSGHEVTEAEGDKNLLAELEQMLAPCTESGRPSGLVFNMAYGIQGECRYTHVPAMLEMAGVPYTGSCPLGHALALDKVIAKIQMQAAGVPTPAFKVLDRPDDDVSGLRYPLVVKPRHESTSYGLQLVDDRCQLGDAVASIVARYRQDALVEEYIDGREVCIGLLGNGDVECLPAVELDFGGRHLRLNTWDDKYHKTFDEPRKICPAPLGPELIARLGRWPSARSTLAGMKDYARVDIRIAPSGDPLRAGDQLDGLPRGARLLCPCGIPGRLHLCRLSSTGSSTWPTSLFRPARRHGASAMTVVMH